MPSTWPAPSDGRAGPDYDALVDRIVESHRAVMATLDFDVRLPRAESTARRRREPDQTHEHYSVLEADAGFRRHRGAAERERRERERAVTALQPRQRKTTLEAPLVTRGGILYVPPVFEQVTGLDEFAAARLVAAGYRSVGSFLRAPDEELAELLRVSVAVVVRAKRDMDLTRLPQVDESAADLLRVIGYPSVSRLAIADPELLGREVERFVARHRFLRRPAVLSSPEGRRRLIAAAEARSG